MVRKEDIVKVGIEWPENKQARLGKACPRHMRDPRNCEICPWFAGYWDIMSRNIDFMQRWLGTSQRRVSYVQCGAPAEVKKPVEPEQVVDSGMVIGLSQDSPKYDEASKAKTEQETPVREPEPEEVSKVAPEPLGDGSVGQEGPVL